MESVLDALYMNEKIISRSFQWHRIQAQIHLELMGIIETRGRLESVTVLRHYLLGCWAVSRVSSWDPLILWMWLGGYARPNPHIISSRHHIRVMALFKFSFYRKTESFIVTGSISPFTVI